MAHFAETNQAPPPYSMLQYVGRGVTPKLVPRNCLRYLQATLIMGEGGLVSEFMWGIVASYKPIAHSKICKFLENEFYWQIQLLLFMLLKPTNSYLEEAEALSQFFRLLLFWATVELDYFT